MKFVGILVMQRTMKIIGIEGNNVKYANEDSSLVLIDTCDNIIDKDIISLFDGNDQLYIYSHPHMKKEVMRKKTAWFSFLSLLYLSSLLLAIPMSPYTVTIFGTIQPAGILIFPLSFICLDVVNSTVTYRHAKMLTCNAALICLIAAALIKISFSVLTIRDEYQLVFEKLSYLYIINAICILSADQINNFIFSKFNSLLINKLWLKSLVSTVFGQVAYTLIWITLFFGDKIGTDKLTRIFDNYEFKVLYSICLIPIAYLLVFINKRYIVK